MAISDVLETVLSRENPNCKALGGTCTSSVAGFSACFADWLQCTARVLCSEEAHAARRGPLGAIRFRARKNDLVLNPYRRATWSFSSNSPHNNS